MKKVILYILCIGLPLSYYTYGKLHSSQIKSVRNVHMQLKSPSFGQNESIPKKFTCQGANISPALQWSGVPSMTKSLALICDDPDAPGKTWVHWVVYNLPPNVTRLDENANIQSLGGKEGMTDFGSTGYGGPCPPSGTHRYFFKLYALDVKLDLPDGVTKEQVLEAMQGHELAKAELMGTYKKD